MDARMRRLDAAGIEQQDEEELSHAFMMDDNIPSMPDTISKRESRWNQHTLRDSRAQPYKGAPRQWSNNFTSLHIMHTVLSWVMW